jgi:hypothetical protein
MRDGPFDREMFYTFTESGVYQIVFGANLMAEGPLSGTVDMTMLLN